MDSLFNVHHAQAVAASMVHLEPLALVFDDQEENVVRDPKKDFGALCLRVLRDIPKRFLHHAVHAHRDISWNCVVSLGNLKLDFYSFKPVELGREDCKAATNPACSSSAGCSRWESWRTSSASPKTRC